MSDSSDQLRPSVGIALMLVAAFNFSIMGALVKYASQYVPAMETVFFRAGVNLVILLPVMLVKRKSFLGRNRLMLATRSLAGFISLSLGFYVVSKIALADAAMLQQTSILFLAVLATLFLGERLSMLLKMYTLLGFMGALMIIKPNFDVVNIPGLLGLTGGLAAAVAFTSIKKLHETESSETIIFNFTLYSTVGSLLLYRDQISWPDSGHVLWALLGIGFFGALAQLPMTRSYLYAPSSVIGPYAYSGILFSGLWGAIFWHEIPDRWSLLGAALLITAGVGILKLQGGSPEVSLE